MAATSIALTPTSLLAQTSPQSPTPQTAKQKAEIAALPRLDKATNDLLRVAPYYQLGVEWKGCASYAVNLAMQMATTSESAVKFALLTCSDKTQYLRSLLSREVGVEQADVVRVRVEYILAEATRQRWALDHPQVVPTPAPNPHP